MAIIARHIMSRRHTQYSKGLIIRFLLNNILLIASNFIKLFIVRVDAMMNLLVCELFAKKIEPAWNDASSIIFIAIYAMAYHVSNYHLNIFGRIFSF